MKKLSLLILLSAATSVLAQSLSGSGEIKIHSHDEISPAQRQQILNSLENSRKKLIQQGKLSMVNPAQKLPHPKFTWPVKFKAGEEFNYNWSISNFVDHNSAFPNAVQDWNCGNRTYDTNNGYNHAGTDIFVYPFPWYQMDYNIAEVVAAAPGIILQKDDGNNDRSCAMGGGSWNAVYIQHADGSVAWYGHLKKNSLTTKNVGDSVAQGEFLGIVGSSGNSTGPHLHFEVYNASNQLTDPYLGPCNTWNSATTDSWWQSQRSYQDPKLNKLSTHSSAPVYGTCPTQEQPNYQNNLNIGQNVLVYLFAGDLPVNTPLTLTITNADNATIATYTGSPSNFWYASYFFWTVQASKFSQPGIYMATVTGANQSISHFFGYGATLNTSESQSDSYIKVENPINEYLNIVTRNHHKDSPYTLTILSADGRVVNKTSVSFRSEQNQKIAFNYPAGLYLIKLENSQNQYSFRVIKK